MCPIKDTCAAHSSLGVHVGRRSIRQAMFLEAPWKLFVFSWVCEFPVVSFFRGGLSDNRSNEFSEGRDQSRCVPWVFVLCSYLCSLLHVANDKCISDRFLINYTSFCPPTKIKQTPDDVITFPLNIWTWTLLPFNCPQLQQHSSSEPPDTVLSCNPLGGSRVELWPTTTPLGCDGNNTRLLSAIYVFQSPKRKEAPTVDAAVSVSPDSSNHPHFKQTDLICQSSRS